MIEFPDAVCRGAGGTAGEEDGIAKGWRFLADALLIIGSVSDRLHL